MASSLSKRLHQERWPFCLDDLPTGTVLVGGAVRDGLLGRLEKQPDLDLVVPAKAVELANSFAEKLGGKCVLLDVERDIARLVFRGWTIDFARQIGSSLEDDLWSRDYRLNAIALTLEPEPIIVDPTGGVEDLFHKRLVAVKEKNLVEDPVRLLRGLRLMAEHHLLPDAQTIDWIQANSLLLQTSAPERIQYEIQRLVNASWADKVIPLLQSIGLLGAWENSLKVVNQGSIFLQDAKNLFSSKELSCALPLARLTHLLSDEGLFSLRFSRRQRQRCATLRKWQKRNDGLAFGSLSEADRLQLHKDLERDLPALIFGLSATDQVIWLNRWRDLNDPLFHPSSPVNGHTLQKCLNLPSGFELGQLMRHLCQERAFGRLLNREDALKEARDWWKQNQTLL